VDHISSAEIANVAMTVRRRGLVVLTPSDYATTVKTGVAEPTSKEGLVNAVTIVRSKGTVAAML